MNGGIGSASNQNNSGNISGTGGGNSSSNF